MNAYRFGVGLLVAMLFAVQGTIQTRLAGTSKEVAGYAVSLCFFLATAEFATQALGRWIGRGKASESTPTVKLAAVMAIAGVLLVLNLGAKVFSPYFSLQHRPPPVVGVVLIVVAWVSVLWWARRSNSPGRICLVGLVGSVAASRALVVMVVPFERLTGDMLATIDRSLTLLLSGRFPYVNLPPPMPYLPGILLSYAPAKWLGGDLRLSNVVCEGLSVVLATGVLGREVARSRRVAVEKVALPLLMLNPVWTYFGANSQYAPFLLVTVIFARAILAAGPLAQAGALGLLLGTNQMLVVAAPIVFSWWIGRHGLRKSTGLAAVTVLVFLAIITPFLAWRPADFLKITFDRRGALPLSVLAGRFTLYPLIRPVSGLLTVSILIAGMLAARRVSRPGSVLATVAVVLCAAMLVQPVSFSHYFLPVMVLAAMATAAPMPSASPPVRLFRGPSARPDALSAVIPSSSSA
jgi:hypothetical protein